MENISENMELDPERSLIVFVDPLKGFADPKGSFGKKFGPTQITKIHDALIKAQQFIDQRPSNVVAAYLRSEYIPGQFTKNNLDDPLSFLCVPGANKDCEWAKGVKAPINGVIITKGSNDAWEKDHYRHYINTRARRRSIKDIIMCGCTTTTCVKQTSISTQKAGNDLGFQVTIPRDLVGCRLSKYEEREGLPTLIEETIEEMRQNHVRILESSDQIVWK